MKRQREALETILRSCYYWEGVHLGTGKIDLEKYIRYCSGEIIKFWKWLF